MKSLGYNVVTRISRWSDTYPVYYNEGYENQQRQLLRWMQQNFGKPYGRWYTEIQDGRTVVWVDTESAATWVTMMWE